jgi:hypothetical protein
MAMEQEKYKNKIQQCKATLRECSSRQNPDTLDYDKGIQ